MKSHRQLLCLGVSASIALAELSLPAAPRLAFPPEGVAFGEIAAGEAASKSVEIRNVSSSPVAVSQVKGCCGADEATADRYEARNDALRSIARRRDLPEADVDALTAYLRSHDDSMRVERVAC